MYYRLGKTFVVAKQKKSVKEKGAQTIEQGHWTVM